jgi:hypothetical protein
MRTNEIHDRRRILMKIEHEKIYALFDTVALVTEGKRIV